MNQAQETELLEAIQAVDQTLGYLDTAATYLESASKWGLFDMLGGGLLSTMVKRGKMSDAEDALAMARASMQAVRKELADVHETVDIEIELGDFLSFADYFLDGAIADWMVQSRIRQAQAQIDDAMTRLQGVRTVLVRGLEAL